MRTEILDISNRLRSLMDSHKPPIKTAAELSRAMYEAGVQEYSTGKTVSKNDSIRNTERNINYHLDGRQPDTQWIKAYCEFFGCSADYLMGFINLPSHKSTDISGFTGLTESSIDKISNISHFHDGKTEALNAMIEDNNFEWVLSYISRFQSAIKNYKELLIQKQEDTKIMISEIASNTDNKTSRLSQEERKKTDENFQKVSMNVDALEFQIDTEFRKVIDDIKKESMKKG